MYAILDIETTGGQYNQEGITEIAIYKFDGNEIIDRFISLVNPEIPIQPFVIKLTGINNAMLRSAPKFYEVAKRIIEITDNCIIVAHNAQFDYRILRTEFKRLGYDFNRRTLCTVELSKQLIPDQKSYSLGKLVYALGIPITDRHRASGDALATVKLFKMLLNKDLKKEIVKSFIKKEIIPGISPRLQDITESIPSITGIYYIHKEDGNIIFIGKSKNIKKRIHQHFTSASEINKKIQNEVYAVTYENTGSELIALLKEKEEIRINRPVYNTILKKKLFPWALYAEKDPQGYLELILQKTDGRKKSILSFTNFLEGKNELMKITEKYQLYKGSNGFDPIINQNLIQQIGPAILEKGNLTAYNTRVLHFIAQNQFQRQSLVVIDKGRTIAERSAILIENGKYIGYAFYDLNYQINTIEILKNIITPMENNPDARNIIQNYIRKRKVLKTISF